MKADVQKEHLWLSKFVGDWNMEAECLMGPDQPPVKTTGSHTVRMLGNLWMVGEGEGECPDGTMARSIITLGYDPEKKRFVGTFVASMMTHLWPYEGALDGNVLTLNSEGPSFSGDGSTVKYQDIIEAVNDDHWILRSRMPSEDGKWVQFMTAHYRRRK
jgi:Protein of unknown function (DUF1579)